MKKINVFLLLFFLSITSFAHATLVKKSRSKICHTKDSIFYSKIKKFQSFSNLKSCLNSGGRLPKKQHKKPKSGYSRAKFGKSWKDFDSDCQSTRTEALISQSTNVVKFKTAKKCKVIYGKWISPYSGKTYYNPRKLDADHIIALHHAWQHGANLWSESKRVKLANDPRNIWMVEASLNRQKGDKGLKWLPPKNRCQYIARYLRLAKIYNLTFTNSEKKLNHNLKTKYCN